jgi:hypothetical protein
MLPSSLGLKTFAYSPLLHSTTYQKVTACIKIAVTTSNPIVNVSVFVYFMMNLEGKRRKQL